MTIKSTAWWRGQIPTAVLLLIIAVIAVWALSLGIGVAPGVAPLDIVKGIVLVVVGFFAGLLGGLIGTGGCSVMLPIIHFWMGYPAAIAVGTTLFAVIFTALSGGYGHVIQRNVDVRAFLWLGGGGIVGVLLGSWLFMLLSGQAKVLGLILGVIFLWPAIRMIYEGVIPQTMPKREGATITGFARAVCDRRGVCMVLDFGSDHDCADVTADTPSPATALSRTCAPYSTCKSTAIFGSVPKERSAIIHFQSAVKRTVYDRAQYVTGVQVVRHSTQKSSRWIGRTPDRFVLQSNPRARRGRR